MSCIFLSFLYVPGERKNNSIFLLFVIHVHICAVVISDVLHDVLQDWQMENKVSTMIDGS
jgi:hypothetical protein